MYVQHRSAGIGDIPNKCHQRQCIRFTCQVHSVKAPSNPSFVIRRALIPRPPRAENDVCVLQMTVCRWVFCGGVENTEGAALPRRLSGTSILLTGLLISHNAFNRTQFAVESPRVDCSPLIYTVTNPGLSNTNLSQLASLLGCKGVFNLRSPSFSPGC